ncbi:MFS transporter [Porticoccus sp. W117]|uniref:MFS transporter n=1 Tax=Porticoccus sp. W117 TaxID=3054777 RepID=UPI002598E216|nr:MFS transporter [Porticoccus sp. W117]MDM3872348.1 MFS transporter [Porticoccus sp. W117]
MHIIRRFFQPDAKQEILHQDEVDEQYPYWRKRVLYSITIGYAVFYFVRKNMSVANPLLREEFGIGKEEMGAALGIAALIYGLAKFISGLLADTLSPRAIMSSGLVLSALISLLLSTTSDNLSQFFGMSVAGFFGLLWIANNIFQGMGQPPCSRLLTQWFSPSEIGKNWGIWNASHHIGGAVILVVGGYLVTYFESWRAVFVAPGAFALIFAIFLFNRLRDRPESAGLPSVEVYKKDMSEVEAQKHQSNGETALELFSKYILKNKLVWIVSIVNLFVYIVRIGVLDWAPSFLKESRGLSIVASANATAVFEIAGIAGAIAAGWLSDTVFKGRRGRVSILFMGLLVLSVLLLLKVPTSNPIVISLILFAIGFFVHGPMLLMAVAAADFATKKSAATAVGLTGLFGYIGAFAANYGTGYFSEHWGWDSVLYFYLVSAFIGMALLAVTWNSRSPVLENYHR